MTYSTGSDFVKLVTAISEQINANKDQLNKLDAALGDGDHGTGISGGFSAAADQAQKIDNPTPADVLKTTAMALMNTMGGSSGALYGTFFLKASVVAKDKTEIDAQGWVSMCQAGLDGVMQRGKAERGGKTMVDALAPAVDALSQSVSSGASLPDAIKQAALAADSGAKSTTDMMPQFGRAKFTGDRAIGHQDAGATSIALMFRALCSM